MSSAADPYTAILRGDAEALDPLAPETPDFDPAAPAAVAREVVIERKTGRIRQAGAAPGPEGAFITEFRAEAERSLFVFGSGVLGLTRLTKSLHLPICQWLTKAPPYRKLYLLPRGHLKTSIARALCIHILIQPRHANLYFPDCRDARCLTERAASGASCALEHHHADGLSQRILYAGETSTNAQHQLRWIEQQYEGNTLLRGLWPDRCWTSPRRESSKWNDQEMLLPRSADFPEASVETIGVGGAVTGRHYTVQVKDDLISIIAANSDVEMQRAIGWQRASRSLFDNPDTDLEFNLGTRWAVGDLWDDMQKNDPTVSVVCRGAIEDGQPIFPEMFSLASLDELKRDQGALFWLLYMNSAENPELTDFAPGDLRFFELRVGELHYSEDERDLTLLDRTKPIDAPRPDLRGMPLTAETYDVLRGREEYLRFRAS